MDDAGVYRLDARRALVCTTDFFSPVVDDPRDFGRIAAANALSDVYAMGGRPLLALNLVAFPSRSLGIRILGKILEGGAEVVAEAGAVLIGGHSVEDAEPKYGLAVVGEVPPNRVFKNVGARPGDHLLLTKPIGSGVITTGIKRKQARPAEIRGVTKIMATLNRAAAEVLIARHRSVHAVTDVTGYGLLGHLLEMLEGSKVAARLRTQAIPVLPAAMRLARAGVIPGGTRANLDAAARKVRFVGALAHDETMQLILADAQTSGGLLAAVSPRSSPSIVRELDAAGVTAAVVGEIVSGRPGVIVE
jgi:selenide,water dikinase